MKHKHYFNIIALFTVTFFCATIAFAQNKVTVSNTNAINKLQEKPLNANVFFVSSDAFVSGLNSISIVSSNPKLSVVSKVQPAIKKTHYKSTGKTKSKATSVLNYKTNPYNTNSSFLRHYNFNCIALPCPNSNVPSNKTTISKVFKFYTNTLYTVVNNTSTVSHTNYTYYNSNRLTYFVSANITARPPPNA